MKDDSMTVRKDGQTRHMPGPWTVRESDKSIRSCEGDFIADCETVGICVTDGQAEANARLIAAAPDLEEWGEDALSCLKEYRQYGEEMRAIGRGFHPTGIKGHSIEAIISGLENAIRKAKGE